MNNLAACLQAFCAGGDVKEVVTHAMAGRFEYPDKFFTTEYSVNER
jgi:enoyl-CoA hydratase/carnithine racemase